MAGFKMTKRVDADPASVFDVFSDMENAAHHVRGIERIEMLTDGPVGVGTRFKETRIMFKREATEEMEFTAWDPGRSFTLGCEACGCRYETTFRFEPDGGGTLVRVETEYEPVTFLSKLMMPFGKLMMGPMKKCIDNDLEDLKALIECGPPEPQPALST